jgi:hypothetical protein
LGPGVLVDNANSRVRATVRVAMWVSSVTRFEKPSSVAKERRGQRLGTLEAGAGFMLLGTQKARIDSLGVSIGWMVVYYQGAEVHGGWQGSACKC